MLNKKFRLTKRKEFGYIYKNGKKFNTVNLTLVTIPTKLSNARFGFVLSKKVGHAFQRNKIKRQLSEIVRVNWKSLILNLTTFLLLNQKL
jgi:ribonuclease P protein component